MMQEALFGFGLVLSVLTWTKLWRRTVLDDARDKLFDLRDKTVREYFVSRGLPLDHPTYTALRTLINGHLRHTEKLTLGRFAAMVAWGENNAECVSAIREKIEKQFQTDDKELSKLVEDVRQRAWLIMIGYIGESSILAMLLGFFGMVFMAVADAVVSLRQLYKNVDRAASFALVRLALGLLAVIELAGSGPRDTQAAMEEYALSKGA